METPLGLTIGIYNFRMGMSHADLLFIEESCGKSPRRVCDLGDQDLVCDDPNVRVFGASPYGSRERGSKTRDFWKAVGAEYVALDVVGDCVRFDLNHDSVPPEWERFDLVTNGGDSEHVLNQLNCFTVIHELARVGGVMYHQVPIAGYSGHGLFTYTPKFFNLLAVANHYEILQCRIDVAESNESLPPDARLAVPDASLRIALRKLVVAPFRIPLDGVPVSTGEHVARKVARAVAKIGYRLRNAFH
jgi:hypothetical protein